MTDYPNLSDWNAKLSSQADGFALWFAGVILICLYVLWARRRWPMQTRIVGMGAYLLALAATGSNYLPVFVPVGILGYLGHRWYPAVRRVPMIAWILLTALLIRLPGLFTESLWYDETFTYGLARLPLHDMMTVIRSDVHPPLWYLIEWFTIRVLGSSEAALRLPSLIFGVLVVWLIYRLAKALQQPQQTALVAAALVAVMTNAVYYSNEARGYSLLAAAILLMTIGILENKKLWFAVGSVVALYTHNLAWFYFGVMSLAALWSRRGWLWTIIVTGLAGGAWLPIAIQQSGDIANGFWLQTFNLGDFLRSWVWGLIYRIPEPMMAPVTGGLIGLNVFGVIFSLRWLASARGRDYLAMVLGAPVLIALASTVWHNVYIDRAVLASSLGLVVIWARLLTQSYKGDKLALMFAAAPLLLMMVAAYYDPAEYRLNASVLQSACRNTDITYTTTNSLAFISTYYMPHAVVWPGSNDLNQQLPPSAKTALGWQQADFDQVHGRVCLIDAWNALSNQRERDYVAHILEDHPPTWSQTIHQGETYTLRIHIIDVKS